VETNIPNVRDNFTMNTAKILWGFGIVLLALESVLIFTIPSWHENKTAKKVNDYIIRREHLDVLRMGMREAVKHPGNPTTFKYVFNYYSEKQELIKIRDELYIHYDIGFPPLPPDEE